MQQLTRDVIRILCGIVFGIPASVVGTLIGLPTGVFVLRTFGVLYDDALLVPYFIAVVAGCVAGTGIVAFCMQGMPRTVFLRVAVPFFAAYAAVAGFLLMIVCDLSYGCTGEGPRPLLVFLLGVPLSLLIAYGWIGFLSKGMKNPL